MGGQGVNGVAPLYSTPKVVQSGCLPGSVGVYANKREGVSVIPNSPDGLDDITISVASKLATDVSEVSDVTACHAGGGGSVEGVPKVRITNMIISGCAWKRP